MRLPLALRAVVEEADGAVLTNARVTRIEIERERVSSVATADGRRFRATKAVVSNIHVTQLPEVIGRERLPADFVNAVERWQPSLAMFVTHYALSAAPRFRTMDGEIESVTMGGLQSLGALSAMLDGYRTGRLHLDDPVFLVITPTLTDASRAPAGKHTFKVVSFFPYAVDGDPQRWDAVKHKVSSRLFDRLAQLSTNLSREIVLAEYVESPLDLERRNPANWRGSCHGGASSPSQSGWFRPAAGWSSYRMPIAGLYQTGSCTHPGGSVSGLPGRNCARVLLEDLGIHFKDVFTRKEVLA
jgi:phytoene dehydrogenase-like protein